MSTDPDHDRIISPSTAFDATTARATLGPVTRLVRRVAWQMNPRVVLRYDAADDLLLVHFPPLITAVERTVGELYVGLDGSDQAAHCTTVCLAAFARGLQNGDAHVITRRALGERLWLHARALAANRGSFDKTLLLDRAEASALTRVWSAVARGDEMRRLSIGSNETANLVARNDPSPVPSAASEPGSPFTVAVIPVSNAQLREVMAQWSAEVIQADQPGHAVHGGGGTPVHGEWEQPGLVRIGVRPRLAWEVEPGDPPELVIRGEPMAPAGAARATGRRIEVQLGERTGLRAPFKPEQVGTLAARMPLPVNPIPARLSQHLAHPNRDRLIYVVRRGRRLLARSTRGVRGAVPTWVRKH
jgi:hypothetical protein